ncbi:hypothetical protein GCM10011611_03150 [Aliidongia dinghuensis]|uniref:Uncharacterized protein n=1 Tax=Aliidongia dinghuensis TaxID=1867774 RepID=A0A8J3E0D8_9PROT|nr:hypothetical protein GCM10011611_03150 [Aliidongia dinghuensis]
MSDSRFYAFEIRPILRPFEKLFDRYDFQGAHPDFEMAAVAATLYALQMQGTVLGAGSDAG